MGTRVLRETRERERERERERDNCQADVTSDMCERARAECEREL